MLHSGQPPSKEIDINILIQRCIEYMTVNGYKASTITNYKRIWKSGILKFMQDNQISLYKPKIGTLFVESVLNNDDFGFYAKKNRVRSIRALNDILQNGTICFQNYRLKNFEISVNEGDIGKAICKWIKSLEDTRRKPITIKTRTREIYLFQQYLKEKEVVKLCDINECHITDFLKSAEGTWVKEISLSTIKCFFKFLSDNNISHSISLNLFLNSFGIKRNDPVPSVYTVDEIREIEQSIERESSFGKRNWAMVLLASRLGMRASDIANLKFCNIFWEESKIRFKQYKTGNEVELPLIAEVGNAILDYLKNGRRQTECDQVFLSCAAPYRGATSTMVSSIINKIIRTSGISIKGRHHGPHSLRHSVATSMLEDGVIISTISDSLGHRDTRTTMNYIRTDIQTMKKCMLDVPVVSPDFYSQCSNAFYE